MARRPADQGLPIVQCIDLDSDPDMDECPIDTEDDDYDTHIEDIPGVRRLGIRRGDPNVAQTAPSKLYAVAPWIPNHEIVYLPKKLDFSTTGKSIASLVNWNVVDMSMKDKGKSKREEKLIDVEKVKERKNDFLLWQNTQKDVEALRLEAVEHINAFKATIAEKDRLVDNALNGDINALKETTAEKDRFINTLKGDINAFQETIAEKERIIEILKKDFRDSHDVWLDCNIDKERRITRQNREIEDLKDALLKLNKEKDGLIKSHDREIEDLKDALLKLDREKEGLIKSHDREIEDLKDALLKLNKEKEGLIRSHDREIDELRTSFSMETTVLEDRHEANMAKVVSQIQTIITSASNYLSEPQSSAAQVTQESQCKQDGKPGSAAQVTHVSLCKQEEKPGDIGKH